eukprot:scaffold60472_cov18-Tisochrysis_lutea.AAC.1
MSRCVHHADERLRKPSNERHMTLGGPLVPSEIETATHAKQFPVVVAAVVVVVGGGGGVGVVLHGDPHAGKQCGDVSLQDSGQAPAEVDVQQKPTD